MIRRDASWPHLPAHALHHRPRARPHPLRRPALRRGACPPASAPAAGAEGWQARLAAGLSHLAGWPPVVACNAEWWCGDRDDPDLVLVRTRSDALGTARPGQAYRGPGAGTGP